MSKAPIGYGHFTETGMLLTHCDPPLMQRRLTDRISDHDKFWIPLLILVIAVGVLLPFPVSVIQVGIAAFSLGAKFEKYWRVR